MGITVDSTVEEIEEYIGSDEFLSTSDENYPMMKHILVILAKRNYSFDLSYGRSNLDDWVFEYMTELSFREEFSEGGRWHNYITNIVDVEVTDIETETYYVAMEWECAATESQEHGTAELYLVEPVEVTTVKYERV